MGGSNSSYPADVNNTLDTGAQLPLTAAQTLLTAQGRTTRAFELYLFAQQLDHTNNTDELVQTLEKAIEDHKRIIEDLELALESVEE